MVVDAAKVFGLFVSSVDGQPVTRFGSQVLIGADRDPEHPNKILYRTREIVGIPHDEARRYAREYERAFADEALTRHTAAEWTTQQKQQLREVGAPRDKLSTAEPSQIAKDPTHADHEGGSKLR